MPAFCPLCATDDRTEEGVSPDGERFALCRDRSHGEYFWELTTPEAATGGDGVGHELDVWAKLLECVPADGAVHAYGDVEDRFFERFPEEAQTLLVRYGHRWRDDAYRSTGSYSMSAYLALRLSELAGEGQVVKTFDRATGPWAYNEVISHWERITSD